MSLSTSTSSTASISPGRWRRAVRALTVSLLSGAATVGLSVYPSALGGLAHAQPTCQIQNHNVTVKSGSLDILASQNRCWATNKARLIFQSDGNLVVYNERNQPVFASNTRGRGHRLIFQSDGNLVVYNQAGILPSDAVFATGTVGHPRDILVVQTDGNVVIYTCEGKVAFATNTEH
ncbi:MAG TPA: hypothetical protein VFX70_12965 [Mycobacteriales bacterium]|nr:hypothetical protein [Mycobacteriales bacterium]